MKNLTLALAATLLMTTASHADGIQPPWVEPPITQPAPAPSFAGFYAGLSYGRTDVTTDIDNIHVRECQFGTKHGQRKCAHGGHEESPEIMALERGNAPWNNWSGGDPVVYDEHQGLMYGEADSTFRYTTLSSADPVAVKGKDALNVLVDIITHDDSTSEGAGVFAGYRVGSTMIGGVEVSSDGTLSTAELSGGLALGSVLPYGFVGFGQYDGAEGTVAGAGVDVLIGGFLIGGKWTSGDFGDTQTNTVGARVAYRF